MMSLTPAPTRRLDRALDSLWYLASAPPTLALLAALLALTLAFAASIPQAPTGIDAAAEERWLAPLLSQYGGLGPFLLSIGAFSVLEGVWFHILLAALALNLALRFAAQMRFMLRPRASEPPVAPAGLPMTQATVAAPLAGVAQRMADACRAGFPVIHITEQENHTAIYAERRRSGAVGPGLTYLGGLILLAGLLVNALLGWGAPETVILAPGAPAAVGPGETLGLSVAAAPEEPASDLTVMLEQDGRQAIVRTRFAWPGRWGHVWLAQRATGPALAITARDRSGRPVTMQSLAEAGPVGEKLELLFGQTQNEQAFAIPTSNLTLRAVYYPALPEQGVTQPVYQVEAYREDETAPLASALVEDQAEMALEGVTLTLRSDRYVELAVAYWPGLALLALGGGLLLLGALVSCCYGPVRTWVDVTAERDHVQVVVRHAAPAFPQPDPARLLAAAPPPTAAPPEAPAGSSHDR